MYVFVCSSFAMEKDYAENFLISVHSSFKQKAGMITEDEAIRHVAIGMSSIRNWSPFYQGFCKDMLEIATSNNFQRLADQMLVSLRDRTIFSHSIPRYLIRNAFFIAVSKGNIPLMHCLLKANKKLINEEYGYGRTALLIAAENENLPLAQALVQAGANLNVVHEDKAKNPLIEAARTNNIKAIRVLLEVGAQPDLLLFPLYGPIKRKYKLFDKRNALMIAACGGNYEAVQVLLDGVPNQTAQSMFAQLHAIDTTYFHILPIELASLVNCHFKVQADPHVRSMLNLTLFDLLIAQRDGILPEKREQHERIIAFVQSRMNRIVI